MAPMTVKTPLTLRSVVPVIPKEPGERAHLEEDLTRIKCIGLLSKPWSVKDEGMVRELIGSPKPVQWDCPSTAGSLGCGEMERSIWIQHRRRGICILNG